MARLALFLSFVLAGCSDFADFSGPTIPFTPPPEWRAWYAEMESCVRRRGDFDRVHWVRVEDSRGMFDHGELTGALGLWRSPHTIFLGTFSGVSRESHTIKDVVTHEILHDLEGNVGHPSPQFGTCAPL